MKKIMIAIVAVIALSLAFAAPAFAGGNGAVKMDLSERMQGDNARGPGSGPVVGWAIANTTGDGRLAVEVHLDNGEAKQTFDVYVKINWTWYEADIVQMTTNNNGKGNAHSVLDMDNYPVSGDSIVVQVVVKPQGSSAVIGYATDGETVPLKKYT